MIVHMVSRRRWVEYADRKRYRHPSLDTEGFIHCSDPEQVEAMANGREWPADEDYLLLCIDPGRLEPEVVYEGEPVAYPHVYGPIGRKAVLDVVEFERGEDGEFVLPDRLRPAVV